MTIIASAMLPTGSRDIHQKPSIFNQLICRRDMKKNFFSKSGCPRKLIN